MVFPVQEEMFAKIAPRIIELAIMEPKRIQLPAKYTFQLMEMCVATCIVTLVKPANHKRLLDQFVKGVQDRVDLLTKQQKSQPEGDLM